MKNTKALPTTVGILFAISAFSSIATFINGLVNKYYVGQNLINFFFAIGLILLALSMFQQNIKLCLFGASLQVIGNILTIKRIFDIYGSHLRIANLVFTLLTIVAWSLVVLAILKKNNQTTYCIISAGLILAVFLIRQIYAIRFWGSSFVVTSLLRQLLAVIPIALMGNVIADADFGSGEHKATQRLVSKNVGQESQFEKLTKLKELLDTGIITQEEFDEKKKQLLGL